MKQAFGYIRRSSHKQKENNSVEIQKSHIQEFAKRNGMVVPDEFIFIEDVTSAFSKRANKRKELMRLQEMINETKIPRVLFYEESRMDRTGYSFVLDFYRPLYEKFPEIEIYTTNSEVPINPDNPQVKINFLMHRQESEIKSERAIGSLYSFLEGAKVVRPGSKVPYGYDQIGEKIKRKLVPNENAGIVTFIFYLQSWGVSMGKIATILNEAEIPSPTGKKWRANAVENILKNKVYTGTLVWNIRKDKQKKKTYTFEEFHEPLINPFFLCLNENNIKLQNKFGRLDTPFLFLNKLCCSECNTILITQNGSTTRNGRKYQYHYYVCKDCGYKLDINDVHNQLIPQIFKHVQGLTSSDSIRSTTIKNLNSKHHCIQENIINLENELDKLKTKGCIAEEENDREFLLISQELKDRYLNELNTLLKSQHLLEELYETVVSNLFFDRFHQLLESQLGDSEKRLIILYFVDKVLVSPNQPSKIVYQENVFSSFDLFPAG